MNKNVSRETEEKNTEKIVSRETKKQGYKVVKNRLYPCPFWGKISYKKIKVMWGKALI